ncbi:MAG: hypothetical protein QOH12_1996 [Solirubrobacteraceae bacterium]|jgi:hypothetical protein|nr:hypothetical protein [Solirubrobacteraceae bacterium]
MIILESLWVRPEQQRNGIARHFAVYVRDVGLPTYLAFANRHVAAWFNCEFRPSDRPSRLQEVIATAMRAPGATFEPGQAPDSAVFVQAEASALRLWRSWPESSSDISGLDQVLGFPVRADIWTIDGGEVFEAGFSDSAFAEDRQFGYALQPWWDAWGPAQGPFASMGDDPYDEDYDDADAAYAPLSSFTAGSADGWVIDPEAMCAYATVRRFLRTLAWHDYHDVDDAARELFVRDLRDEPRGLRGFSALVTPVGQASE